MKLVGNKKIFISLRARLLDVLFPIFCLGCGREGVWLCDNCRQNITFCQGYSCPECGREIVSSMTCEACNESVLSGLWVITHYHGGVIKNVLRQLKYGYSTELSQILGLLVWEKIERDPYWNKECVLAPVPLHRRRFLQRGFNQAQLIAEAISEKSTNKVISNLLIRKIHNKPQAGLALSDRLKNVEGIFEMNLQVCSDELLHKTIVLIDDVYTTGATMKECATILKKAGFSKVYGLAIARG